MITGDGDLVTSAQPNTGDLESKLIRSPFPESSLTDILPFPVAGGPGCPFTRSREAFRDTGTSLQLSLMWNPSLSAGSRSLRWLISLIAKVMVCIQRRARALKLNI